ncbi:MAG TPA: YdeI/OmpD-associated family protein, partial [Thermoanaerobaculia bacterium]|nr:YdeI/OmpD-associated family protein [Thermoanaerobaculia bacterium]
NHATADELVVGFWKKETGKPSMTWSESVDEALCFGWIDGVRRRIDDESYSIRFTPRRPTSIWSAVNIKRMGELVAEGRVRPAGLAAFERRSAKKSAIYAYEQRGELALDPAFEDELRRDKAAWKYLQGEAPWYRRNTTYWVMSAKQETTRRKRLRELIAASAAGGRIKRLIPAAQKGSAAKSG